MAAAGDAVGGDTGLLVHRLVPQPARDDADGAGDRQRGGEDLGAVHADPVAARGGDVALADHDRLAGVAQGADGAGHQVAGQGVAAWGIGAQHHRLDVGVADQGVQGRGGAAALDAGVHGALADREDHGHGRPAAPAVVGLGAQAQQVGAGQDRAAVLQQPLGEVVPAGGAVGEAQGHGALG